MRYNLVIEIENPPQFGNGGKDAILRVSLFPSEGIYVRRQNESTNPSEIKDLQIFMRVYIQQSTEELSPE